MKAHKDSRSYLKYLVKIWKHCDHKVIVLDKGLAMILHVFILTFQQQLLDILNHGFKITKSDKLLICPLQWFISQLWQQSRREYSSKKNTKLFISTRWLKHFLWHTHALYLLLDKMWLQARCHLCPCILKTAAHSHTMILLDILVFI